MINIKCLCIFSLSLSFGYLLAKCTRKAFVSKALPFYTYADDREDSEELLDTTDCIYKENGEWIPLYQQYSRGQSFKTIGNAVLAGKISEAILISNLSPEYMQTSSMFRIYSINNDLWGVYEEKTDSLLLLFQQKDCKMLYIAKK